MRRIQQAGLRPEARLLTGVYAPYSKVADVEAVVIAVRYIDDKYNVSKAYVEYDCKDLRTGQVYQNARRVDQAQGMDDGNETILRSATKVFGASSTVFDAHTAPLESTDGDRVVLSFTYGAQHGAVIKEVLPHPRTSYGATKNDGFRRLQTHAGTDIETKKDGTYEVRRGNTKITIGADGTIVVVHKSGSKMRFLENGDIDVVPAGSLLLGEGAVAIPLNGVLNGSAVDPFTGSLQANLGNASTKVFNSK